MQQKRSQITLFIVLGFVVLVSFLYVFNIKNIRKNESPSGLSALIQDSEIVKLYVDSCLSIVLKKGVVDVGLQESQLEDYLNQNLNKCIDFENFKGLDIQQEPYKLNLRTSDYNIFVDMNYKLTLSKGKSQMSLSKFRTTLDYSKEVPITQNQEGTTKPISLASTDGNTQLIIPEDTQITINGKHVTNLQISIIDNRLLEDLIGFHYVLPIGHLAYTLSPDKALIEPNSLLSIHYDESLIPQGLSEENLRIASFDETINQWVVLPTTVDTEINTLSTALTHFSTYSPVLVPLTDPKLYSLEELQRLAQQKFQPAVPERYLYSFSSPLAPMPGLGAAQLNPTYTWETKVSAEQFRYGSQSPAFMSAFMPLINIDQATGEVIVQLIPHTATSMEGWLFALHGLYPDFKTQLKAQLDDIQVPANTKYRIENLPPELQGKSLEDINQMSVPTYGYMSSGNPPPSHSAYNSAMQTVLSIAVTPKGETSGGENPSSEVGGGVI